MLCYYTSTRMVIPEHWKHQILGRMQNNRNSHSLLMEKQNGSTILEDSLVVSYKTKHTLSIWSNIVLLAIYPKEFKHMFTYCSCLEKWVILELSILSTHFGFELKTALKYKAYQLHYLKYIFLWIFRCCTFSITFQYFKAVFPFLHFFNIVWGKIYSSLLFAKKQKSRKVL